MTDMEIRDATAEDAERIHEIYAPYVKDTPVTMEIAVPTVENMRMRIRSILECGFPYIVAVDRNGEIAGYAYAAKYHEREGFKYCSSLSIYLDESIQSRGIGQMLYDELEKRLKERGTVNLVSVISGTNEKSINFHKKNGFKEIGYFKNSTYKLGKWHDIITFNKVINKIF